LPGSRNEETMSELPQSPLRVAALSTAAPTPFTLEPDAEARTKIAESLGISGIKKLRFIGALAPQGSKDWSLKGTLGATVVQPCGVTLAPVTTRIDETVTRYYVADLPEVSAGEVEMPEDDSIEALPDVIDVSAVMIEALALALPAFPRAEGAELAQTQFAEPGVAPMTDDDAKPFAGLAGLRETLENKDD